MDQDQRPSIRLTAVESGAESVKRSQLPLTALVDVVQDALVRAGLSQKAAAQMMRMDQGQLSKALRSGALPLQKLELLGAEFMREFIKLASPLYGLSVTEVDERQQLLVKMAAALNDLLQYEAKR